MEQGKLYEATFTEWEGTKNQVIAIKHKDGIQMIYEDGLSHMVTEQYFMANASNIKPQTIN